MKRFVFVAALLALAGCSTAEDRVAADDATCRSYGIKTGTPEYAQCRMLQDARRDARQDGLGSRLQKAGKALGSINN